MGRFGDSESPNHSILYDIILFVKKQDKRSNDFHFIHCNASGKTLK